MSNCEIDILVVPRLGEVTALQCSTLKLLHRDVGGLVFSSAENSSDVR